ncbi:hypothetical protein W822_15575 [Advenella kashmirensis W13003]|uniref:Uncharacterized protein n=1 Tax=Advenella kashmirensis W13003 TaxID=1424334 RepID=V8QSV7_9BURK|nr:hypothetical protein [Advenella kashmirensis]ETF02420.1 hypothetical protein W822_15575 [Advenella kashmirensis W13003]
MANMSISPIHRIGSIKTLLDEIETEGAKQYTIASLLRERLEVEDEDGANYYLSLTLADLLEEASKFYLMKKYIDELEQSLIAQAA